METFPLSGALKTFSEIAENPSNFDEDVNKQIINDIKLNIKDVYDHTKEQEIDSQRKIYSLSKLFVKDLNSEQIWQQIEIQNEDVLPRFINKISALLVAKNKLNFKNFEREIDESEGDSSLENGNNSDEYSGKGEIKHSTNQATKTYETDESSSNDEQSGEEYTNKNTNEKKQLNSSVDDEFFKLSEMEIFLNAQERLTDPGNDNDSDSNDSENEGSIDFFKQNEPELEEEDESKIARFKDYFVIKDDNKKKTKTNKLLEEIENDEAEHSNEIKSSLQLRQELLKKKIDRLEEQAVSDKPWQLKGEITAESRPQNSLLEEIVGFDLTSRPAPIITEQTSLQLEDIIRQRIKDKVFDSVERKMKPIETALEFKKKLVLDQEKSKLSLAQVYEQEYQQGVINTAGLEQQEEEPKLHSEIKLSMENLFSQLDALSNFHFTSKPSVPELKITSHLPAINMEEVAPVAASEATLLAPEEIRNKQKKLNKKLRKKKKMHTKLSKKTSHGVSSHK